MTGVVSYLVFFATMAGILAIVVLGLNLQWGFTGLFNGGVAAFFGAGAYVTMLLGGRPEPGQFIRNSRHVHRLWMIVEGLIRQAQVA